MLGLHWLFYVFVFFYGLGHGLTAPASVSMAADIFQGKSFGSIYGFVLIGFGVGGALGPFLGGLVYDITKAYTVAIWGAIAMLGVGVTLAWLASPRKVRLVPGMVK